MRPHGTSAELERRRRLAVAQVRSGYTQQEVAKFFLVSVRSVGRWMQAFREHGHKGLKAKPASGCPPKLSPAQEREVLQWFGRSPREFGFSTELWSAPRVADVIRRKFHTSFHPRYINQWLACRRVTSQKPERQASEQDAREVRRWLREEWPRIKKLLGVGVRTWF
jgi:transposase